PHLSSSYSISQQNRACHCHRSDRPLSYPLYQLERVSQGAARLRIGTGPRVALIGDEVDHLPLGGVHRRVKAARSRHPRGQLFTFALDAEEAIKGPARARLICVSQPRDPACDTAIATFCGLQPRALARLRIVRG